MLILSNATTKSFRPIRYKYMIKDTLLLRSSNSQVIFLKNTTSISMEIERGNCASILGTVESPRLLEELFDLFDTKSDHYHS